MVGAPALLALAHWLGSRHERHQRSSGSACLADAATRSAAGGGSGMGPDCSAATAQLPSHAGDEA
jgi:hypothetical protein